jgi:O-antigen ligase
MTYSRGGAIALVVVLVISFMVHGFRRRRLILAGIPFLLAAALLIPREFRERVTTIGQFFSDDAVLVNTDSSVEERLVLMGAAWEMLIANPLLGVGAGNYTARFGEYAERFGSVARDYEDPDAVRYAHNLYLEVGAETGSLGLLLFGGCLLLAFRGLKRGRERLQEVDGGRTMALASALQISLTGYLVSGLFLHGDFERYLWLFLGMAGALHALGRMPQPIDERGSRER